MRARLKDALDRRYEDAAAGRVIELETEDEIGGDKRRMRVVLSHLDDVNHKMPMVGGTVSNVLDRIEKLLTAGGTPTPSLC